MSGLFCDGRWMDENQGRHPSGVFFLNFQSILYNKGKHKIVFGLRLNSGCVGRTRTCVAKKGHWRYSYEMERWKEKFQR